MGLGFRNLVSTWWFMGGYKGSVMGSSNEIYRDSINHIGGSYYNLRYTPELPYRTHAGTLVDPFKEPWGV